MHLPVERSPASPTAGAAPTRDRARGAGSEGTQVIEVSPPSLHPSARSPPPTSSSPPPTALSTQRAQLRSPSPHQLAPVIPHFLLNATPPALSLLTSQHPLRGNGEAARKTGEGERGKKKKEKKERTRPGSRTFSATKKKKKKKRRKKTRAVELNARLMFRIEVFTAGHPEGTTCGRELTQEEQVKGPV